MRKIRFIHFICDHEKTTQALNFFAIKSGGSIKRLKAMKLLFFADRYHLRKYGRLLSNDNYLAMQHGPVPSTAVDITRAGEFLGEEIKQYSSCFISPKGNYYHSLNAADESVFSESDLEALNYAWNKFGQLDEWKLRNLTHEYPEWKKHKKVFDVSPRRSIRMDVMDFFIDPDSDVDRCFSLSEKEKAIRREQLAELAQLESLWS